MPDEPQTPLFRKAALAHKRRALYGEVILKGSLSSWVFTWLLLTLLIVIGGALLFGQVQTDEGAVPLWKWLQAYTS